MGTSFPRPERETERVARLHELGILDTVADPILDDMVRIAAVMVGAPIALVGLIDRDRQWFKARHGLDVRETSREAAFCAHAIMSPHETLVVENALEDPRFRDNPLVRGAPHIRFYAGVPLVVGSEGLAIGTLCVVDTMSRTLSQEEQTALEALARLVKERIAATAAIRNLDGIVERLQTTEEELRRTRGQLDDAVESLDAALIMHDAEGRPVLFNHRYAELRELIAFHAQGPEAREGPGGNHVLVPGEYQLADRWYSVSNRRTREGAFMSVLTDITSLKHTQQALLVARDAAEAAANAKARFLATMSHEIRTPMNGVIGMTDLLRYTPLTTVQREYVETVRSSGDSLLALINDILDFSKIEAGKLTLECVAFDPRTLVEETAMLLSSSASEKGLRLVTRASAVRHTPMGDPTRLRQILVNLVGNAVKFTSEGEVVILAETMRRPNDKIALSIAVRDTGIGIATGAISHLFQAFSQADFTTTRRFGGTGLGLAISRSLALNMGGDISVESEPGMGSVFRILLELPAGDARPSRVPRFEGRRALCVEVHESERRALREELRDLGFAVDAASSARDAIARLPVDGDPGFDLVVAGEELLGDMGSLARHRALSESLAALPFVATTASETHPPYVTGVAGWVRKPLRRQSLATVLESALTRSGVVPDRPVRMPSSIPRLAAAGELCALVVEDNEVNARVAKAMLERLHWKVQLARDGVEALEALERAKFDIVWMDCQMPRMDGFAAVRSLRRREPADARAYVVAVTANAIAGDREACIEAGMDDYVSKPMRKDDVERAIARWRDRIPPLEAPTSTLVG